MAPLTLDVPAAAAGEPECAATDSTRPQTYEIGRIIYVVQHNPPVEVGAPQSSHKTPSGVFKVARVGRREAKRLSRARVSLQHRKARSGVTDPDHLVWSKVLKNRGGQLALAYACGAG